MSGSSNVKGKRMKDRIGPYWFRLISGSVRLGLMRIGGAILNLAGAPGFVRECDYEGRICDTRIKVRISHLFTIVTVDGLDIYFKRTTGTIDGIGLPTSDYRLAGTSGSTHVPELHDA